MSAAEKAHKLRWNTPGICRAEHRSPGSRPLLLTNVTVPLHNEYYLAAAVVDNIQEGLMCWQLCTNKWVKATFGTLDYKQHEDNDSNLDCGLAPLNRANSISAGSRFACVSWRLTGQVRGMCCVICRPERVYIALQTSIHHQPHHLLLINPTPLLRQPSSNMPSSNQSRPRQTHSDLCTGMNERVKGLLNLLIMFNIHKSGSVKQPTWSYKGSSYFKLFKD